MTFHRSTQFVYHVLLPGVLLGVGLVVSAFAMTDDEAPTVGEWQGSGRLPFFSFPGGAAPTPGGLKPNANVPGRPKMRPVPVQRPQRVMMQTKPQQQTTPEDAGRSVANRLKPLASRLPLVGNRAAAADENPTEEVMAAYRRGQWRASYNKAQDALHHHATDNHTPVLWYYTALSATRLGMYDKARSAYEKTVETAGLNDGMAEPLRVNAQSGMQQLPSLNAIDPPPAMANTTGLPAAAGAQTLSPEQQAQMMEQYQLQQLTTMLGGSNNKNNSNNGMDPMTMMLMMQQQQQQPGGSNTPMTNNPQMMQDMMQTWMNSQMFDSADLFGGSNTDDDRDR